MPPTTPANPPTSSAKARSTAVLERITDATRPARPPCTT